ILMQCQTWVLPQVWRQFFHSVIWVTMKVICLGIASPWLSHRLAACFIQCCVIVFMLPGPWYTFS
ncbi:uncharacterized protein C8Q71DRAFT_793162, partial [Rhodofomes roseus]